MYCYKCGLANTNEARYCRVCGVELQSLISPTDMEFQEKYAEIFSRGVKGAIISIGFLIVTLIAFAVRTEDGYLWLLMMPFIFVYFAGGIARFVQAKVLKQMRSAGNTLTAPAEPKALADDASFQIFQTSGLTDRPYSVTENTTNELQLDLKPQP